MRTLETERLRLRDFVADDWPAVGALLTNAEAVRYMHFAHWTTEQRQTWFSWCLENQRLATPDAYNWAIVRKDSAELIGWFGIGTSSHPTVAGERDFGYLLARAHWGHGYMTETLQAVLAYEFETLDTPCITATCDTANPASARVMEKAGMQRFQTVFDTDFEGNWAERHHYILPNPRHPDRLPS